MICKICRRKIGNREPHSYALVKRVPGGKPHKVYACAECKEEPFDACKEEPFDAWLDSRAVDSDADAEPRTPIDAYVIALDETSHYEIEEADKPYIRQIRGVYVFDRNERTHLCELTPSYYLIHVWDEVLPTEAGEALDDRTIERLYEKYEYCGGDDIYVHCHTIEALIDKAAPFTVHHHGDTEVDEQDVDHDEQMDALREHFSCNHPF